MASLGDLVTLLKGAGSWVTIADPASTAVVRLSLRDDVTGDRACLGTVVVATYAKPHRRGQRSHRVGLQCARERTSAGAAAMTSRAVNAR